MAGSDSEPSCLMEHAGNSKYLGADRCCLKSVPVGGSSARGGEQMLCQFDRQEKRCLFFVGSCLEFGQVGSGHSAGPTAR